MGEDVFQHRAVLRDSCHKIARLARSVVIFQLGLHESHPDFLTLVHLTQSPFRLVKAPLLAAGVEARTTLQLNPKCLVVAQQQHQAMCAPLFPHGRPLLWFDFKKRMTKSFGRGQIFDNVGDEMSKSMVCHNGDTRVRWPALKYVEVVTPTDTDSPVFLVSSRSVVVCNSCACNNWDSAPISEGHALITPKWWLFKHQPQVVEAPRSHLGRMFRARFKKVEFRITTSSCTSAMFSPRTHLSSSLPGFVCATTLS